MCAEPCLRAGEESRECSQVTTAKAAVHQRAGGSGQPAAQQPDLTTQQAVLQRLRASERQLLWFLVDASSPGSSKQPQHGSLAWAPGLT